MKLWARVFLGYFLVVGLAGWFVLRVFVQEVKPGVREAVEDVMVDSANLLAELARDDLLAQRLTEGRFGKAVEAYSDRTIHAPIWGRDKQSLDFRVYVTDAKGIVRFDSENQALGLDYSSWRDVGRTLRGEYGARSTRDDPDDEQSGVLYIAAPVLDGPRIAGVVTVAKPVASLAPIIARSEQTVLRRGALLLLAALLIGVVFTAWLTHSMNRLVSYARALARGERAAPPSTSRDEIGELSRALALMREELDGRAYVERYVQHLTHEMKSPLAAIRGAAEVLAEPLPEADRQRFAASIATQAGRLHRMADQQLRLAQIEQQRSLDAPVAVNLKSLCESVSAELSALAARRRVKLDVIIDDSLAIHGDTFLLQLALANLIQNAIDFSPPQSTVICRAEADQMNISTVIDDNGPGIPDFALPRVFERFFSLPRPDGTPKSTGLGLALAREIALLHGGHLDLANGPGGGARATLTLPRHFT